MAPRAIRPLETWFIAFLMFGFAVPGLSAILLPLVVIDAGHRPFRVGAVVAFQNWGIVLSPLWGWAGDRFAARRAIFLGALATLSTALLGLAFGRSLSSLLACGFLLGVGTGACNTLAVLLVIKTTSPHEWGSKLAALQLLGAVGTVMGLAMAGFIGPRSGMLAAAFLAMLAVAIASARPIGEPADRSPQHPMQAPPAGATRWVAFALFLQAWFLLSVSVAAFAALYPITMAETFGVGVRWSSTVMAAATLASLPLYGLTGRGIARLGPMKLFLAGAATRCLALAGMTLFSLARHDAATPALWCAVLFQAAWPLIGVASSDLAAVLAPRGRGTAVGVFQAAGAVGSGAGALLGGSVADLYGYPDVLRLATIVAIASMMCGLVLRQFMQAVRRMARQTADDAPATKLEFR